MNTYRQTAHKG